jgi:hypothetical protein
MKTVKLTPPQTKLLDKLFEINLNNGMSESKAEKDAIKGLKEDYPELNQTLTDKYRIA